MFWLRNKKNNFQLRTLICGPGYSTDQAHPFKQLKGYTKMGGSSAVTKSGVEIYFLQCVSHGISCVCETKRTW